MLLNAVIATRDFSSLVRHGLASSRAFRDQREAFEFIRSHLNAYGELPSVESVIVGTATAAQRFEAMDVVESIDTLAARLKERNLKLDLADTLKAWAKDYGTLDGYKLLSRIRKETDALQQRTATGTSGINWTTTGDERYAEYEARKMSGFGQTLPALFEDITRVVGGYERGDVITFMAFTGRGKSWLGLLSALATHKSGYKTLFESCEMSKDKCAFRLDTLEGGFSNRDLWLGTLDMRLEDDYKTFTTAFTQKNGRPDLIIKASEDWADGLTLTQLEADIDATGADIVVIDQFNLLTFDGNDRNAKTQMSRRLKQLAARKKVVIVVLYQTNGDYAKGSKDAEGAVRPLNLPKLANYSETIALIQDSSIVYGFDAVLWKDESDGKYRGKAILGVLKGRDGGEGSEFELEWMPNDGVIRPRRPVDVF